MPFTYTVSRVTENQNFVHAPGSRGPVGALMSGITELELSSLAGLPPLPANPLTDAALKEWKAAVAAAGIIITERAAQRR